MTWYSWSSLSLGSASMHSPTSEWVLVGWIHGCETHGSGGPTVITRLGIRHSSQQRGNPVVSVSTGGCGRGLHIHDLSKTRKGSTIHLKPPSPLESLSTPHRMFTLQQVCRWYLWFISLPAASQPTPSPPLSLNLSTVSLLPLLPLLLHPWSIHSPE